MMVGMIWNDKNQFRLETEALLKLQCVTCHACCTTKCRATRSRRDKSVGGAVVTGMDRNTHTADSDTKWGNMMKHIETLVTRTGLSWQFHKDPKISKASHFYLKDVESISMMLSIHSDSLGTSITPNHIFPSHSHAIFTFTLIIALYIAAGQFYLARDNMQLRLENPNISKLCCSVDYFLLRSFVQWTCTFAQPHTLKVKKRILLNTSTYDLVAQPRLYSSVPSKPTTGLPESTGAFWCLLLSTLPTLQTLVNYQLIQHNSDILTCTM